VGFVNTCIETLSHEEISIPECSDCRQRHPQLLTACAVMAGCAYATKVTIGYDVPWRQVQRDAAARRRTDRRASSKTPEPRVLQTALQDFYVEYTLLVTVDGSFAEIRPCSTN
jgi:hypothetical protein